MAIIKQIKDSNNVLHDIIDTDTKITAGATSYDVANTRPLTFIGSPSISSTAEYFSQTFAIPNIKGYSNGRLDASQFTTGRISINADDGITILDDSPVPEPILTIDKSGTISATSLKTANVNIEDDSIHCSEIYTDTITGNTFSGESKLAKTFPFFNIKSSGTLDGQEEYVHFATISLPETPWQRYSATLFFQDFENTIFQGDILTIKADTNGSGVGNLPLVEWKIKRNISTINSVIISKINNNEYNLFLSNCGQNYVTLKVFYMTVASTDVFNFISNNDWSTDAPPATSYSTLESISSYANTSSITPYGICNTTSGDPNKVVELKKGVFNSLVEGSRIVVLFNNRHSAPELLLNVNNTGSIPCYYKGNNVDGSILPSGASEFVYDGKNWHLLGGVDTNTDTKCTSVSNHYAPSANSNSELTASISGNPGSFVSGTEYTVLTGVKAQRDAKGHVTGLTYTAQKIKGSDATTTTDTKDTAGSTQTTAKIFLVGATSQGDSPVTYSNENVYVTDGTLTATEIVVSGSKKITTSKIKSDADYNLYFAVKGGTPLVIADDSSNNRFVAPGSSYSNQYSLGTSSRLWKTVYATTFYGTTFYGSSFYETSDERLKDIINPVSVNLDTLSKLRKVYFKWKDKSESKSHIGIIAQDIQEIYPEIVSEENGQLSVSYDKLSVIALEAIDVLHNENKELKNRVEKLEILVNQLSEKIND